MKRMILAVFTCVSPLVAQTPIGLPTQTGKPDFAAVPFSRSIPALQSLPATCNVGQLFFDPSAATGANFYTCAATNSWNAFGGYTLPPASATMRGGVTIPAISGLLVSSGALSVAYGTTANTALPGNSLGQANGAASLDANGHVPVGQLGNLGSAAFMNSSAFQPALGFTPANSANKGQPNGYASLNSTGQVPLGQLPVIPAKTSQLTNDAGFVNTTQAAAAAAVQSVNGQTGTIVTNYQAVEVNGSPLAGSGTLNIAQGPGTTVTGSTSSGVSTVTVTASGASMSAGSTVPSASACSSGSNVGALYQQTGVTQVLWICSYNGSSYLWMPESGSFTDIRSWGAKCDGSTVDTAAIQAAINAGGVSNVFVPPGTCIISAPNSASSSGITLKSNLYFFGIPGQSVLKLKNANGEYAGLFKCLNCTNLTIENLVIDANISNNPITSQSEIASYPRQELQLFGDAHVRVRGVTIQNSSSVNSLDCNACSDVDFESNSFINMGADPNNITHDASAIYVSGASSGVSAGSVVTNNRFQAASMAASNYGATTAMEIHIDNITVSDNQVWGYQSCMNITGIDSQEDDVILVTGNTCDVEDIGVQIWSQTYNSHSSGYGLNGLNISGNGLRIRQTNYTGANPIYGIAFNANLNLPVRNVKIDSNTIVFDQENTVRSGRSNSVGIGYIANGSPTSLQNITVTNNIIDNAPIAGVKFTGALENVRVLNNTITDAGSSLDATVSSGYKVPIFISSASPIQALDVNENKIVDDFPTSRTTCAFYLASGAGSKDVNYYNNDVTLTGSSTSSWAQYFSLDSNSNPVVKMNATQQPWTHPNGSYGSGSAVYDQTTNTTYFTVTGGNSWLSGFSGVKTVGACVMTFVDGRVTGISGC